LTPTFTFFPAVKVENEKKRNFTTLPFAFYLQVQRPFAEKGKSCKKNDFYLLPFFPQVDPPKKLVFTARSRLSKRGTFQNGRILDHLMPNFDFVF